MIVDTRKVIAYTIECEQEGCSNRTTVEADTIADATARAATAAWTHNVEQGDRCPQHSPADSKMFLAHAKDVGVAWRDVPPLDRGAIRDLAPELAEDLDALDRLVLQANDCGWSE